MSPHTRLEGSASQGCYRLIEDKRVLLNLKGLIIDLGASKGVARERGELSIKYER